MNETTGQTVDVATSTARTATDTTSPATRTRRRPRRNLLDFSFHLLLLFKGLFATGEILAGLGAVFVTPQRLNRLITWVTEGELSQDPGDWLMNKLILAGQSFTSGSQYFVVFYLLSHGVVKLAAIVLLWKKQLWAYPLSIVMFVGFMAYQMVRYTSTHSIMMILLTLLDVVMIWLTVLEYRKIKASRAAPEAVVDEVVADEAVRAG